jgi:peptidoglycan/LPS O-acetylase OafA/YrhL
VVHRIRIQKQWGVIIIFISFIIYWMLIKESSQIMTNYLHIFLPIAFVGCMLGLLLVYPREKECIRGRMEETPVISNKGLIITTIIGVAILLLAVLLIPTTSFVR